MIIESKGIKTDNYYIPPFNLNEGEIVVIFLYGGAHFYNLQMELTDIFSGKIKIDNVKVLRPLTFVNHFKESSFRRLFFPVTVGEYIEKNGKHINSIAETIYNIDYINKKTKVNSLAGNPRKLLSLYSTLSQTKDIIFDLVGQDPQGAKETYEIVKDNVRKGGSAILLDWTEDMKNDCTKFITIEWTKKK